MSNPSSGKTKIVELEVVKGFPENILEVRTMTEDKFIENHGSGSLRKAKKLGTAYKSLYKEEREKGVLDADCKTPSRINAYAPGYIDKDLEVVGVYEGVPNPEAPSINDPNNQATIIT